jgi:sugar phosphate isomerase/epimerase
MITDREPIERRTEAYRILVDAGLMAARFSGTYQIPREPWEMEFVMLREMDPEAAKAGATAYLQLEFEGTGIQFFRVGASATKFVARFYRRDC